MIKKLKENRFLIILLFISSVLLLANIWNTGEFFCDDEYIYIRMAEEMYNNKNIWTPTWFGEIRYFKPPFTYWLMMLFFPVGGTNITTARISIAFISVLTIFFLYKLAEKLYGKQEAYLSGLLTCTCFGYLIYGKIGMMDMPLTFFLTLSIYYFYMAFREKSPFYGALFFAFTGASSLVKGPVSIVILFFFAVVFLLIFGGWKIFINVRALWGVFVGICFIILWPIGIYMSGDWNNWYNFFILRENFGKFHDPVHYTFLDLLPYYLQFFFPWSLLFLGIVPSIFKKKYLCNPSCVVPLLWFFCNTAVFLIPETKLKHYTIPALPALSLIIAFLWYEIKKKLVTKISLYVTAVIFSLLFFIIICLMRLAVSPVALIFLTGALVSDIIMIIFLIKGNLFRSVHIFALLALMLICAGAYFSYAHLPPGAIPLIKSGDSASVGVFRQQSFVFSYYLNIRVVQISSMEEIKEILDKKGKVIIAKGDMEELQRKGTFPDVNNIYSWEQWKRNMSAEEIYESLYLSDMSLLKEPVYILTGI
ncbi:MAG: glycosyltransferase family 39 protein [Candidatus Eremiobacterota bacterium]